MTPVCFNFLIPITAQVAARLKLQKPHDATLKKNKVVQVEIQINNLDGSVLLFGFTRVFRAVTHWSC